MKDSESEIMTLWEQASADDVLKELGEMSEEEHKYYMNLHRTRDFVQEFLSA